MRILGIDYGTRRIGLAVSDADGRVAFPLSVVAHSVDLVKDIFNIIKEREIEKIVVGESRDYDMNENAVMKEAREFVKELSVVIEEIPIEFHQEFLTSVQASKELHHAETPRGEKVRGETKSDQLDAQAAAIMLQSYLDLEDNKLKNTL